MEAFDFALGLRVVRGAVLLLDAEEGQEVFEGVASAAESGGVNPSVVGEGGGGRAVGVDCGQEGGDDVVAGDRVVGGAGQQVAGVVVEPVQDLDVGAVGEAPVGEVGLPGLVGLRGFEPEVGRPGSLPWFRDDQAGGVQDASDRGGRRCRQVLLLQVPGQGDRACVQPRGGQLDSKLHDPLGNLGRHSVRAGSRCSRAGFDRVQAAVSVTGQESVQMATGEPVLGCRRGHGQLLGHDLQHGDTSTRHVSDCDRCPDSSGTYQLRPIS